MDVIPTGSRVWFNPAEKIFLRGRAGDIRGSDYICKKGLDEVEPQFLRAAEQHVRSGGIFDTSHSSTIKAVIVLDQVLATTFREFRLREACQIIKTPELVLSTDVATLFAASTRVLTLEEAAVLNQTYARTTWDLAATGKNVSHIALSDEAQKQAVHDALRLHIDNAARALAKAENTQLATILEGNTAVAQGDWGAMTTNADFNNRNPADDLQAVMTTIWDNGFNPDTLALHPRPWADFISNTFIHNLKTDQGVNNGMKISLLGFPTLNVIVDPSLTNTKATLLSKSGSNTVLADGPTEAAQYRDEVRGMDGYVIRQWTEAKVVVAGAGRTETSVSA